MIFINERITIEDRLRFAKAMIKGTSISVHSVLLLWRINQNYESVLKEYPVLDKDDIDACLQYSEGNLKHKYLAQPPRR